jgi:hypothetical protein
VIRVYFNKRGPRPWSVDKGTGTKELTFKSVSLQAANGIALFDPKAGDNLNSPTAWIEFADAVMLANGSHVIIQCSSD